MDESVWERLAGWMAVALIAVLTTLAGLLGKRAREEIKTLRQAHDEARDEMKAQALRVADNDKRIDMLSLHVDNTQRDIGEIKASIESIHKRISAGNRDLSGKLDRLLSGRRESGD